MILVRTSNEECNPFKKKNVVKTLLLETNIAEEEAMKIARAVERQVKKYDGDTISSATIREMVDSQLINRGEIKEAKKHQRVGIPASRVMELIKKGTRDNSNLYHTPETIHKIVADETMKMYALEHFFAPEISKAHIKGEIHISDMDYAVNRPLNCVLGKEDFVYKDSKGRIFITTIGDFVEKNMKSPILFKDGICSILEEDYYVISFNHEKQEPEWKKITKVYKKENEEVFKVSFTKNKNISVTKDHKFFNFNSATSKLRQPNTVPKISRQTCCTVNLFKDKKVGSIRYWELPEKEEDPLGRIVGFFLGDGSLNKKGNTRVPIFLMKKVDKIKYLHETLDELGVEYAVYYAKSEARQGYVYTLIKNGPIKELLVKIHENDKHLPDGFLTKENSLGILGGLINSDGYLTINKTSNKCFMEFSQVRKHVFDVFNVCCLLNGITPSFYKEDRSKFGTQDVYKSRFSSNALLEVLKRIKLRDKYQEIFSKEHSFDKLERRSYGPIRPKSIKKISGLHNVYDIEVEENHSFVCGNGFILTHNCLTQSLQFLIRNGLKVDGSGRFSTAAGPARRFSTLINHAGQALQASQTNMAGGQSLSLWNVHAAPFVSDMSYEEVKKQVQAMVFQFGMSFVSRGGQSVFSSVNTEFTVPEFIRDKQAWGPDGKPMDTYGDYEEETRMISRALAEVMIEGDVNGRAHRFPNAIWVLRPEMMFKEFDDDLLQIHELSAKHSSPYLLNLTVDDGIEHASVLGCRSRLNDNWSGDYTRDTFTGNLTYNTINLNRTGIVSKDEDEYFDDLDDKLSILRKLTYTRRDHAKKCLNEYKLMPYLLQEGIDRKLYNIDDTTLAIGYCGLHESLVNLGIEDGLISSEGHKFGLKVIERLNDAGSEFREEDGLRWSVIGTPMETGAGRFAELDLKYHPDAFTQGPRRAPYLTNSSHLPVNADVSLWDRVKLESKFHPLSLGGNILNLYLGEAYPDPQALMSLTKKIAKTDTGFFAYTGIHGHCYSCASNSRGLTDSCGHCGSEEVVTQSRITGYMSTISQNTKDGAGWNNNKISELRDRRLYKL